MFFLTLIIFRRFAQIWILKLFLKEFGGWGEFKLNVENFPCFSKDSLKVTSTDIILQRNIYDAPSHDSLLQFNVANFFLYATCFLFLKKNFSMISLRGEFNRATDYMFVRNEHSWTCSFLEQEAYRGFANMQQGYLWNNSNDIQ